MTVPYYAGFSGIAECVCVCVNIHINERGHAKPERDTCVHTHARVFSLSCFPVTGHRRLSAAPWASESVLTDLFPRSHECALRVSVEKLIYSSGEGNGTPLQGSCLESPREPGGLASVGSHRVGHD